MGKFDDYLANVDLNNGIPDGFITGLTAAYNDDLSIPAAKIESLETEKTNLLTQLTEKDNEITAAKAKNFDLLMQLPKQEDANEHEPEPVIDSIDDLFE